MIKTNKHKIMMRIKSGNRTLLKKALFLDEIMNEVPEYKKRLKEKFKIVENPKKIICKLNKSKIDLINLDQEKKIKSISKDFFERLDNLIILKVKEAINRAKLNKRNTLMGKDL